MRLIVLAMVMMIVLPLQAQQNLIDSLLNALQQHPQQDSTYLDILHEMSYYYYSNDAKEGLKRSEESIALAQRLNDSRRLAIAYNDKAGSLSILGDNKTAMEMYKKAIDMHSKSGNTKGVARGLFNLGLIYYNISDYQKATEQYLKSLRIFEQLKDTPRIGILYNSLGVSAMFQSDYPGAMEYYLQALRIHEKTNSLRDLANVLENLGLLYRRLYNYNKALEYHQQALKVNIAQGAKIAIANSYGNIGIIYDTLHNTTEAINSFSKALEINQSVNNKRGIASNMGDLGILYKEIPDYPKAYEYITTAKRLFEEVGEKNSTASMLSETAGLYATVPDQVLKDLLHTSPANRYTKTLSLYREALRLAEEDDLTDHKESIWFGIYETFLAQKNYSAALDAYKRYDQLHDSIHNTASRDEIARKEIQFEFDKKEALSRLAHEKQQLLANAEIRQQKIIRNTSIGVTIMLLIAALTGSVLYKNKRDADAQKAAAEFKAQVADTEMKALRSQMNPHFIFNSLNSISDYITRNDTKAADEYLVKFAKVMRMILENSEQKEISLADDLKALELYMQLEALRLKHGFTYRIEVAPEIDVENTLVPPLILQPFVENSIWHGLAKKRVHGEIQIKISRENNMLHCIVEDNGVGRAATATSEPARKSLGMKITRDRIDIINKLKKSSATIILTDLTEGTRVELKLPLELNE